MQADKKVIGTKEADRKIHTVGGSRTHATGKKPRRNLVATLGRCITTGNTVGFSCCCCCCCGGGGGGGGGRCGTSGWKQTKQNSPPSSSANQNLKRQQCFSNKLINKRLILKKIVQIRNGGHSLMTKYQLPAEHK